MSKVVITSANDEVTSAFDRRFGRAAWFSLYDTESGDCQFIKNENAEAGHGAGTKAAEKMVELKIEKVFSGDFGPKAKDLLDRFKIQMVVIPDESISVQEVIEKVSRGMFVS
jgi:predicted Fe-Mo cluster-binding NifX family protein